LRNQLEPCAIKIVRLLGKKLHHVTMFDLARHRPSHGAPREFESVRVSGSGESLPLLTLRQAGQQFRGAGGDDSSLVEAAELLYGTAFLVEGGALEDPARFAGSLADPLARTA
jgi:molecular chaperone HtpG